MKKIVVAALSMLALSGCFAGAASPVAGFLYTDAKGPQLGYSSEVADLKTGTAMCESYLGLIGIGDCSIEAAKKNGGINRVAYSDGKAKNILGLYATYTTVVKGQ